MFHPEDKSFWGYDSVSEIDPGSQLVKLRYKWMDIAAKYPCGHFVEAREMREREKLAKAKLRPN